MNILIYGIGDAAAFIGFILIYSHIKTHYKDMSYRAKLANRLRKEMDSREAYRKELAIKVPITNESFPAKKVKAITLVRITPHGL